MPAQPISAISFHAARSKPSALPLSRILRNAVTGDFSDTHDFAPSRIIVCSSFKTAIVLTPVRLRLLMIEEAKDALGDDVVLDFLAAAEDRRGLAAEPAAYGVELVAGEAVAFPAEALVAHHLDEKLGPFLADARAR